MPYLDRSTARALVESGYMPLSEYMQMFELRMSLQEVASPSIAPNDEKQQRLFISTMFDLK